MHNFRTAGGAYFRCETDFAEDDFANISFFDASRKEILFHVSLRRKTGLVVTNARRAGKWGKERHTPVSLARRGDKLEVEFGEERVSIRINGREVSAPEGEYPGLENIRHVNWRGGLVDESLEIGGEANQQREVEGALELTGFLTVEGWAIDPGLPQQAPRLEVEGLDEPILFERVERPGIAARHGKSETRIGVLAPLPGRIWEARGAEAPAGKVVLRLSANDIASALRLELTRPEVVARIESLCARARPEEETFDLLLAIEHVRHGGLWPALSSEARAVLEQAAELYGVRDYLAGAAGREGEAGPPPIAPANPQAMLVGVVRNRFGQALSDDPQARPVEVLARLLEEYPLPAAARRQLFLAVTEAFCNAGCFEDLYEHAARHREAPYQPEEGATWHNSVILPFLAMDGRLDELRATLWALAEAGHGWVVTPALAWAVRHALRAAIPEKDREDILYAFMGFVDRRRNDYWGRSLCARLVDTSVDMVVRMPRLARYLRREITSFALRAHGLSQRFWQRLEPALEEAGAAPDPVIAAGLTHFTTLREVVEGRARPDARLEQALDFFETWGNGDAARFRREILGHEELLPAGRDAAPLHERLLRRARVPDEAVLRSLAAPGAAAARDPGLVRSLREAVHARHDRTPKAPYYDIQLQAARRARALARQLQAGVQAGADGRDELSALLDDLAIIASQRSEFLGLGMGLALIDLLLGLGRADLATHALVFVSAERANVPKDQQPGLYRRPAIHAALMGLAAPARAGEELAQAALALFPAFDPQALALPEAPRSPLDALFDTVVVVFSCRSNLEDRIPAMRESWLSQLEELGIPWIVVVGDGDGRREGDVVYLEAPDDYEGLPQKTLAAVRWVRDHMPHAHMLKIDDDCFLNVGEFFDSLSYRKFDYYGRVIERPLGSMDRSWHFGKSASERGRKELDKSPEPSVYCDGGSGYVLSRHAMNELLAAADLPEGRRILLGTFMEDKMVGDLLGLRDIRPAEEDYLVAVQRRTHPGAVPVSRWENGFWAGPLAPTKLVHLDSHQGQGAAMAALQEPRLWPRKIWPTHAPARLGAETNLLELVSDEARLAQVNKEPLAVVACLRNEMFMLPHFLDHYRRLGVRAFVMVDNCSDDGSLEYLLEQPDVAVFSADTPYGKSQYGVAWQLAVLGNLRVGRWSLLADIDELLVYPGWEKTKLPRLLAGKAWQDVDAARIYMLDMYPRGPLSEVTFESGDPFAEAGFVERQPFLRVSTARGAFSDSPTVTSALRHRLIPGSRSELFVAQKYALVKYKPWMRFSAGLHYVADLKLAEQEMIFAHFKYNAHFRQKALDEVARGEHFNDAEEYRKYLALTSEGREVIFDPEISVPWRDCDEVRRIFGQ